MKKEKINRGIDGLIMGLIGSVMFSLFLILTRLYWVGYLSEDVLVGCFALTVTVVITCFTAAYLFKPRLLIMGFSGFISAFVFFYFQYRFVKPIIHQMAVINVWDLIFEASFEMFFFVATGWLVYNAVKRFLK